jgi:benzoyl-CoA-dihydrodiol lyase
MSFSFETHPDAYKHWRLSFEGDIARLVMAVDPQGGLVPGYELKLNSYDLGVDIELADALSRVRFEHPETKTVIVSSGTDRVFCAGANIPMLASSTHAWKVNFCKFTNETRLYIEDVSEKSGIRFLAALNGTCAGGGYELALACDDVVLIDDGNSAVSLPEVPLLGVLPGTGGLTRVVDKRKVRRDRADVFCTVAEGVKGKRAVEWNLVDALAPRSKFAEVVNERAKKLAEKPFRIAKKGPGVALTPLAPEVTDETIVYRHVKVAIDKKARVAEITISAPTTPQPKTADEIQAAGADQWALRAFRELDDAILRLRIHNLDVGLFVIKTRGDQAAVRAVDESLAANADHWLANEILALQARVLRRLETSAKSLFAVADEGSCFAGVLLETALASDRVYMLNDESRPVSLSLSPANWGTLRMGNGLTRLESRFLGAPEKVAALREAKGELSTEAADKAGLVTVAPDEIDWEDEVRVAIEERASLSPDALSGMEASLRFCGPESWETKVFGRLSAWQNWIFQRPNAVGEKGALSLYGKPTRPVFDYRRCLSARRHVEIAQEEGKYGRR